MHLWKRLTRPFRHAPHGRVLRLSPPESLLLGFTLLCLLGSGLLMLPGAATQPLAWHQALFTATSAITVTGLAVMDTSSFTTLGQVILLVLIQIGGLGFMTFGALTLLLLGARLPLQQQTLVREVLGETSFGALSQLVRMVVTFALVVEALGTVLLALHWVPELGWSRGLWASLFHAVSAFNNAGFSLWPDSLTRDAGNPLVTLVVSGLFIVGGLGFVVISDVREKRRWGRFSMQTKVVLCATLAVNLVAMLALGCLEWHNPATLGGLESLGDKLQAAWFQAVTPRTAGFNSVDTAAMTDASSLLTMLLMFIGGGASSTASGIKLTTFIVLILVARAFLRGTQPAAFGRSISQQTVMKAIAVALSGVALVFVTLLVLTITDSRQTFLDLAFESVSAFGTVGLSRGITEELSSPGQWMLILTMLLGRVGPLSLGYFLATRRTGGMRYAEGHIQIG